MMLEVKGIRPAVISHDLYGDLIQFLGFRHVVRQTYGFQLDENKLHELEGIFDKTWRRLSREIKTFCNLLEGKKNKFNALCLEERTINFELCTLHLER